MKTFVIFAAALLVSGIAQAQECQGLSLGTWGGAVAPQYGLAQDAQSFGGTGTYQMNVDDSVRPGVSVTVAHLETRGDVGEAFGGKAFAAFGFGEVAKRYPICAGFAFSHVRGKSYGLNLPLANDYAFFDLDLGRTLRGSDSVWDVGVFATPQVSYTQLPPRGPVFPSTDKLQQPNGSELRMPMRHELDLNVNAGFAVRVWRMFARVTGSARGLVQPIFGEERVELAANVAVGVVL